MFRHVLALWKDISKLVRNRLIIYGVFLFSKDKHRFLFQRQNTSILCLCLSFPTETLCSWFKRKVSRCNFDTTGLERVDYLQKTTQEYPLDGIVITYHSLQYIRDLYSCSNLRFSFPENLQSLTVFNKKMLEVDSVKEFI